MFDAFVSLYTHVCLVISNICVVCCLLEPKFLIHFSSNYTDALTQNAPSQLSYVWRFSLNVVSPLSCACLRICPSAPIQLS